MLGFLSTLLLQGSLSIAGINVSFGLFVGVGMISALIRVDHIFDQLSRVLSLRTTPLVGDSCQGIDSERRNLPTLISR